MTKTSWKIHEKILGRLRSLEIGKPGKSTMALIGRLKPRPMLSELSEEEQRQVRYFSLIIPESGAEAVAKKLSQEILNREAEKY